ncbi:hypothetical protein FocTR4_00011966 [Fusarium oxysporum f. sp. cubense]|uniref:Uncharacterized protein n=1 Tax=Fusarium oxysporum f. sp. cubense TaxID=61366 RepID=A0A5C6SDF3_FUSOC|nr:hypothetical protein FocTR4_00011966 [Fusarium oxysporum f. sp. cubense]
MASEASSISRTPSSAPDFIDIERFFTREKTKPRTSYVCLYCTAKPWKDGYKGNARRHIRNNHPYLIGLSSRQNQSQQSLDVYITSSTTPSEAALWNAFNRQAYIKALISLLTRRRVAFSMVEWDELKDLALACNPAIEDSLITSRRTVMRYISASYEFYAAQLAESLQSAISMIHLSSDLWTSPHRHGMLAAGLIADVLGRFEIRRVGYHTWDNASSNNTCLEALSNKLLHGRGIIFNPVRRRVRCYGHIINLSLQAFLLVRSKEALGAALNAAGNAAGAQPIETFSTSLNENTPSGPDTTVGHTTEEKQGRQQRPPTRERTIRQLEFSGWEGINALQKLHHLAVWIGSSPIHSDNWREAVGRSIGIDNTTRWYSWYKVISVAFNKKAQIVQFMVDHDKDIGCAHLLSGADWDILSKTHTFLQPFTEATLITEGDKASLCSTLRMMDGLLSHFEKAKARSISVKETAFN